MKIIYLHQYFATPSMPGGTRSYELASRLVEYGHEVHVVTTDRALGPSSHGWRESIEGGIHVHWTAVPYANQMNVPRRIAAFARFALRAMSKAVELRGDVVFATSTPLTIAIPGLWAARRNSIPLVFEIRDLWPDVPIAMGFLRNPLARWAARKLELVAYSGSERIVALAPGMKSHVLSKGIEEHRVAMIPNGCDIDLFSRQQEHVAALRESTEWLRGRRLVVYCGAIGLVNGVDYLVRLAANVRRRDPEVRFAVIGAGRMEPFVRSQAQLHGVLDENFFMLGELPKQEAATWVCAADIAVALINGPEILWRHATQNKFFDALAAGKPIANNFRGWQSETAVEANAGLILNADDTELAANELLERLHDSAWMREAGRNAAALGISRFNRDQHAEQLNSVLLSAVDDYRRRNETPARTDVNPDRIAPP